jgi:hypothetical protein
MNNFEQALLQELRTVVADRAASRTRIGRLRRPGLVALPVGAVGVAAAVVVGVSALGGAGAAYAVTKASSGDIVVTINSLSDAAGLQSALRAHGINADVNYDATGTPTPPAPGTPGVVSAGRESTSSHGGEGSAWGSGIAAGAPGPPPGAPIPQHVNGTSATSASSGQASTGGPANGPAGGPSRFAHAGPAPVSMALSPSGSATITIPASDVYNGDTLHITTSGSAASGVAGLQFAWTN